MIQEIRIQRLLRAGINAQVYRGILELAAKFGYLSIEEVEYQFDCSKKTALNRMDYLVRRAGLLHKFDSKVRPSYFYSLTFFGRQMLAMAGYDEAISPFVPSDYRPGNQIAYRQQIRCFIAFRKAFGSRLIAWTSQPQLKKEHPRGRDMDEEFFLQDTPGCVFRPKSSTIPVQIVHHSGPNRPLFRCKSSTVPVKSSTHRLN